MVEETKKKPTGAEIAAVTGITIFAISLVIFVSLIVGMFIYLII